MFTDVQFFHTTRTSAEVRFFCNVINKTIIELVELTDNGVVSRETVEIAASFNLGQSNDGKKNLRNYLIGAETRNLLSLLDIGRS